MEQKCPLWLEIVGSLFGVWFVWMLIRMNWYLPDPTYGWVPGP